MQNGYHSFVWINEDDTIYACFAEDLDEGSLDNLLLFNIEEQSRCLDIRRLFETTHR